MFFDVLAFLRAYACGISLLLSAARLVRWSESARRLVISSACLGSSVLDIWARARAFLIRDGVVRGQFRRTSDGGRGVMGIGLYIYALLGLLLNRSLDGSIIPIGMWSESRYSGIMPDSMIGI